MAIISPGPAVAAVSGSVGGVTFSHNKGGMYMRNRSIPTNPSTLPQQNARARLATVSQAWQALTQGERDSWDEYAVQNPATNALGNSILLSGHQIHNRLNTRLLEAAAAVITAPPVISAHPALTTATQAADIGLGNVDLTFAPVLPAGAQLRCVATVVNSPGITYVKNRLKFIAYSPVDQLSPWDNQATIEAILGTLIVGQTLHTEVAVFNPANGLISPAIRTETVVVTT